MSILKSANSGRDKVVKEFFDNFCSKQLASYEIADNKDVYKVKLSPDFFGRVLNINLKEFPCKVIFDNSPYPLFKDFNVKDNIHKISKDFYKYCYNYRFTACHFDKDIFKFVIKHYEHIERCVIEIPEDFIEIVKLKKVSLSHLLKILDDNNNILLYNEKNSKPHIDNTTNIFDTDMNFRLTPIDIMIINECTKE
jgi:hypothetical protein